MFLTLLKEPAKDSPKTYADFANCSTIKYKYKGASHNFAIETTDVTDYNYHRVNKDASADWKEVEITADMLKQETWGDESRSKPIKMQNATRLSWEIKGLENTPDEKNQPKYPYLYVDDVKCDGLSFKAQSANDTPISSSSAAGGNSSSSKGGKSSSSGINPVSSSSAIVPVSSSLVVSDLVVIDDVEDGDEVLNTTGTWYAYTDKDPGGLSSITNVYDPALPGYVVVFPGTTDLTNGTQGFVGLQGIVWNQNTYTEAPFVALGLNMMADTSAGFDMSACAGISYRYKGSQHAFKIQDGQVQDYAYHQSRQIDAAEWTTVVLTWDKIKQPSWGEPVELNKASIKKMAWEVIGFKNFDEQPEINYLYVDDLKCIDATVAIPFTAHRSYQSLKLSAQGGNLNIMTAKSGLVKVQVYDMTGHAVFASTKNMSAGANSVSLANLAKGSYVVRVQANRQSKTLRLSIK